MGSGAAFIAITLNGPSVTVNHEYCCSDVVICLQGVRHGEDSDVLEDDACLYDNYFIFDGTVIRRGAMFMESGLVRCQFDIYGIRGINLLFKLDALA